MDAITWRKEKEYGIQGSEDDDVYVEQVNMMELKD